MDVQRHRTRAPDPRSLDVAALARGGARIEGDWPLAELARLRSLVLEEAQGQPARVAWSATGSTRSVTGGEAEPELWLELQAQVPVRLQCQRCLQPLAHELACERRLRFVRGAQEAERLDAQSEDDVLELLPRLDLRELVEDELILALPLVPRHAVCPEPLRAAPDDSAESSAGADAAHPFAALAALRRRPS